MLNFGFIAQTLSFNLTFSNVQPPTATIPFSCTHHLLALFHIALLYSIPKIQQQLLSFEFLTQT